MFGHDDQSQRHHDDNQPTPDGTLVHDNHVAAPPADDIAGGLIDDSPAMGTTLPDPGAMALGKTAPNTDALLDIKQQALQQLTPLIGHLEQTPEEKFRTTMMMIQASDNDTLLKAAYESAVQISDEKTRAQALLDIVNEINYFTHNSNSTEA